MDVKNAVAVKVKKPPPWWIEQEEEETQLYRNATTGTSLYFMDWVIS